MVQAQEVSLQRVLEGSTQFQVPLYQRPYQWTKDQWQNLWTDLKRLAEEIRENPGTRPTHFIGSIVLAPSPSAIAGGLRSYMVVDGQQRLTTLTLLLAAIRDHLKKSDPDDQKTIGRIHDNLLTNPYEEDDRSYKLIPTQKDKSDYLSLIDGAPHSGTDSQITAAHTYFSACLESLSGDEDAPSVQEIASAVSTGLSLVSISTDSNDNVYRIFESLNNTGLKLTQGDLVRNHIFMRLPTQGERVYKQHWLALQNYLTNKQIELLLWIDLVRREPTIRFSDTYTRQRDRLELMRTEDEVADEVARLTNLGRLFRLTWHPEEEVDLEVAFRLKRLFEWGSTVTDPVSLQLLELRDQGVATSSQVAKALLYVESLLVRRILTGRSGMGLNRHFGRAANQLFNRRFTGAPDEALHQILSAQKRQYVTDDDLREQSQQIDFYFSGRASQRKLTLCWIEELFGSRERVDPNNLSIEHVMPQTLSTEWIEHLSEWYDAGSIPELHDDSVHNVGNLTLTGYNSQLGNRPFADKRIELQKSSIRMNQAIAEHDAWTFEEIEDRTTSLIERIILYWPAPTSTSTLSEHRAMWSDLRFIMTDLPDGQWTSYGDLASAVGVNLESVEKYLAEQTVPNAHRVLRWDGSVSSQLSRPEELRNADPLDLLRSDGIVLTEDGCARQADRLSSERLSALLPTEDA